MFPAMGVRQILSGALIILLKAIIGIFVIKSRNNAIEAKKSLFIAKITLIFLTSLSVPKAVKLGSEGYPEVCE